MSQLVNFLHNHQHLSVYNGDLIGRALVRLVRYENEGYRRRTLWSNRWPDRVWIKRGAVALTTALIPLTVRIFGPEDVVWLHNATSGLILVCSLVVLVALHALTEARACESGPIAISVLKLDKNSLSADPEIERLLPTHIYRSVEEFFVSFPHASAHVGFLCDKDSRFMATSVRLQIGIEEATCWVSAAAIED